MSGVAQTSSVSPAPAQLPALLPRARQALEQAESVAEVGRLADYGQVCRVAATRAKLGKESRDDWGEFVLDAERRAGQMLAAMREDGTRSYGGAGYHNDRHDDGRKPTLTDLGVADTAVKADNRARRWGFIAELDDDEYTEMKAEVRDDTEKVITEQAFIARGKHVRREREKREREAAAAAVAPSRATVTQAGWREWLPTQPECDLLLTDPPYSTDVDDVAAFAAEWLPTALEKVKPTGRAYVCIGAYPVELAAYLAAKVPGYLELAQVLVWTYRNTLGPAPTHDYKLNWQAILYYRGSDAPRLACPAMVEQFSVADINAPDGRHGNRWHTWQKPDEIAERFIRHATDPGALVLDPFAGTGTFVLAAARLGRTARGADRDPEMVRIAKERGCD